LGNVTNNYYRQNFIREPGREPDWDMYEIIINEEEIKYEEI